MADGSNVVIVDNRRRAGKKLIGPCIDSCVLSMLQGFVAVNPGLRLLNDSRNVVRESLDDVRGKVALVAGGGAGHEPFPAGYVGKGMLAAGSSGLIFSAPPPQVVVPLLQYLDSGNPSGILVFINNYRGQYLNFALAVEKAKQLGIQNIKTFIVGEDCSNPEMSGITDRRGVAGCVLMFKIAGAMAEEGASLDEILDELQAAHANLGSLGVCLNPGSRPGRGVTVDLGPNEIDMGTSLTGDHGVLRMPIRPVSSIIQVMLSHMTNEKNPHRMILEDGEDVVVVVNNLGGTTKLEELISCKVLIRQLEKRKIRVLRAYRGQFMTALDTCGIQFSILKLGTDPERKSKWLKCLDAPTAAPAWPKVLMSKDSPDRFDPPRLMPGKLPHEEETFVDGLEPSLGVDVWLDQNAVAGFKHAIHAAAEALKEKEYELNDLDANVGDCDCGTTICEGADGIVAGIEARTVNLRYPRMAFTAMSDICATAMGGCAGALYSLFFLGAARAFQDNKRGSKLSLIMNPDRKEIKRLAVEAFTRGVQNVRRYGGADAGDRTMLDALLPALTVLHNWKDGDDFSEMLGKLVAAAEAGAKSTVNMKARAGRAAYVASSRAMGPDAGAMAVAIWLRAVCESIAPAPENMAAAGAAQQQDKR